MGVKAVNSGDRGVSPRYFVIDDTEAITGTLREPFDLLIEAAGKTATQTIPRHSKKPRGPKRGPAV